MAEEIERILDRWIVENPHREIADDGMKKKIKKEGKHDGKTHVADIVFSYNNRKLILALRARGACIGANNFDGMRK